MNPTTRTLIALLALAAGVLPAVAAQIPNPSTANPLRERTAFPGRVIVKLRTASADGAGKATGVATIDAILARHGVLEVAPVLPVRQKPRKVGHTDLSNVVIARYADGAPPEAVAAALARQPEVEYAEPQWMYPTCVNPNDPNFISQTGYLLRMNLPAAWNLTKGEQGSVVIGLSDGGTDWRHPDLLANIWTNPGEIAANGIDDDGNGFIDDVHGWNFSNETNDPTGVLHDNGIHGTHTAGICCAVTNNATLVCGTSWNAKLMPICTSSATTDGTVAYGYAGILYAADNGADIVNCSWGALSTPSAFEQDVVTYAWEHGTAVIAASGNNNSPLAHYPSAYNHVLSVANVANNDVKNSLSNYGPSVDVSAQGQTIFSTTPASSGSLTGYLTGTSMSSPQVAGICALIKTRWPGYTPDQVMERVRVTCDNIDAANPARAGLLGYGRVNALIALTKNTPAIRISALQLTDQDGDGAVEPGEDVRVDIQVTNYLAACTGLTFKLRETSAYASPVDSIVTLGSLDSLQSVQLPPLHLTIAANAPIQQLVSCILAISTAGPAYVDKDRFNFTVLPTFATHDLNNVKASVTSVGKIGFSAASGGTGSDGVGFRYKGSENLIYEGSLMIGIGPSKISDAARGNNPPDTDDDFATRPGGVPKALLSGPAGSQAIVAVFNDSIAESKLPVVVHQTSYAFPGPIHGDYVLLHLAIRNAGGTTLTGVRVGWFCDWDLDGSTFDSNKTGFDAARNLGYVYDTSASGPTEYVGVQVVSALGATSYRGIWNDAGLSPDWGVYDGFADDEKWACLAAGVVHPVAGPTDISIAIATGPFNIAPGDSIEVGFAFLGGDNLAALQSHADAAAIKWTHLESGVPVEIQELSASNDNGAVVLHWRTGPETDVVVFRIQRSANGGGFESLGPDVERRSDHTYEFRDATPEPGTSVYRVAEVLANGGLVLHAGVRIEVQNNNAPARTFLAPAAPNPFNPTTTLTFGLATAGAANLEIYDARGQRVRVLWNKPHVEPGIQHVTWDGRDDGGRRVASGAYMARLRAGGTSLTRRLTLLK